MKTIQYLTILVSMAILSSCVSTAKFPVSTKAPAAEIVAKKKQDKYNNYLIELTAENLAEVSRIDPRMNNYSVWIIIDNGITKNIGQLTNKNAKKAVLKTLTPFNVKEIFITAEERGDLSYPSGIEITRTSFNK